MFKKICIVGVGLIGGSIGLAIKKNGLAHFVVGVARRRSSAILAVKRHAVDMATLDLREGVEGADLVVLCAPVSTIVRQLRVIGPWLKPQAMVTDVGSSKFEIVRAAGRYLKPGQFVGSHPMAGLAQTGVRYALADLFQGAQCFMTRKDSRLEAFWAALGCRPIILDAKTHDAWVARTSYLPHLTSFALFNNPALGALSKKKLKAQNPSVRDLARISKSDPELWADILFSNPDSARALAEYQKSINTLKKIFDRRDAAALKRYIQASNRLSKKLCPNL